MSLNSMNFKINQIKINIHLNIHGKNGTWLIHGDTWIIHDGTKKITVRSSADTVKITVHTVKCTKRHRNFSSATMKYPSAVFSVYNVFQ